jgi:hypothetical protein
MAPKPSCLIVFELIQPDSIEQIHIEHFRCTVSWKTLLCYVKIFCLVHTLLFYSQKFARVKPLDLDLR